MNAKSHPARNRIGKIADLQMVAHCRASTRYGASPFMASKPRAAGRSGPRWSRKPERKDRSAGARPLAVPDRRRSRLASLRLPRAAGIIAEKNRAGIVGNSALSTAGRRGIGLMNKLRRTNLQDGGMDTVEGK